MNVSIFIDGPFSNFLVMCSDSGYVSECEVRVWVNGCVNECDGKCQSGV